MGIRSIAVIEPFAGLGGAEISLLEVVRRLEGRPEVHLYVPADGPLATAAAAAGAVVHVVPWPARLLTLGERSEPPSVARLAAAASAVPGMVRRLARQIRASGAELLVSNGIKAHILGALVARRCGLPLLWYLRDGLEGRALSPRLLRSLSTPCSAAIAISRYVAVESRRILPAATPIHVLYNPVDLERFRPGLSGPADLHRKPGEVWFAVVGALTPLKGQDLFLAAAARVLNAVPGARFLLVGDNPYVTETGRFAAELRRAAAGQGLAGRVAFLGARRDLPAILSHIDVLVQPNRGPEGLGRSILEAWACARPVISVDRFGPGEVVQDRVTGLLASWLDVGALERCMLELGRDAALRQRLGKNGRAWVERHVAAEQIATRFRGILDAVVETPVPDTAVAHPEGA